MTPRGTESQIEGATQGATRDAGKGRVRRTRSPHPGIKLKAPTGARLAWRAVYRDPDTGRDAYESLDPLTAGRNAQTRRAWAIRKAQTIAKRRLALADGAPRATGTTLRDAVASYFEDHSRELRASTFALYRSHAEAFLRWADGVGLAKAEDVTLARLVLYRTARGRAGRLVSAPGHKGAKRESEATRKASAVNVELRSVQTVLNYLRRTRRLGSLSSDDLRDGLKRFEGAHEAPSFLRPPQIVALLRAAQAHDAETFKITRAEHAAGGAGGTRRYAPIAPLVAAALLSGMRFGEVVGLDWSEVDLAEGEIHLTSRTKTKRARTVTLDVSPALAALLAAQAPEGRRFGAVWGLTGDQVKTAAKRLDRYGAPEGWTWQALRRTCGTYLTNAPSIFGAASAYRSARQLGHSVTIAERHYLGVVKVSKEATTLEVAMGCEGEIGKLVESHGTKRAPH